MENLITKESLKSKILHINYSRMGLKTTICMLTTVTGFEITGTSSCVDPQNYDQEIGERIAFEEALDKLWELEGYLLQHMRTIEYKAEFIEISELEKNTDGKFPIVPAKNFDYEINYGKETAAMDKLLESTLEDHRKKIIEMIKKEFIDSKMLQETYAGEFENYLRGFIKEIEALQSDEQIKEAQNYQDRANLLLMTLLDNFMTSGIMRVTEFDVDKAENIIRKIYFTTINLI